MTPAEQLIASAAFAALAAVACSSPNLFLPQLTEKLRVDEFGNVVARDGSGDTPEAIARRLRTEYERKWPGRFFGRLA